MKGFFKTTHCVYNVDVHGEKWHQGEKINFTTETTINSDADVAGTITCAHVDLRKLKKGDPKAFEIIYQQQLTGASQEHEVLLSLACPISDGAKATFILVGDPEQLATNDRLELPIAERPIWRQMIETIELFHRFKMKTLKNKTKALDAKFQAPQSKEYSSIDQLNILFSTDKEQLTMELIFKVKKLTYAPEGVKAAAHKITSKYTYEEKDLYMYGDTFNQQKAKADLDEAFGKCVSATSGAFLS